MSEATRLIQLARQTLETYLRSRETPNFKELSPTLQAPCGAFVSLHNGKDLRGCIGFVEGVEPLWKVVRDVAISAATRDPRFDPVTLEELSELDIEISVLTPLEPVADPVEIQVGTHGLLIRSGGFSGLLLPQVATQCGWGVEEFLDQTCVKAGLSPGAWAQPETQILRFCAQIIRETP